MRAGTACDVNGNGRKTKSSQRIILAQESWLSPQHGKEICLFWKASRSPLEPIKSYIHLIPNYVVVDKSTGA